MIAPGPWRHRALRLASPALWLLALLVVLLEAAVWRPLAALGRALGRLPVFAALERLVARLSPGAVVAVFVLPFVPLVPLLKLAELWLLAHRHFVGAALLIVCTKVVGAAFATRVFAVAKPKMLQVRWFARAYGWTTHLLALGHDLLERTPGWAAARAGARRLIGAARAWWRARRAAAGEGLLAQRFAAALRRARQRRLGAP